MVLHCPLGGRVSLERLRRHCAVSVGDSGLLEKYLVHVVFQAAPEVRIFISNVHINSEYLICV